MESLKNGWTRNFCVATLNVNWFNGVEEVITVFVLNFLYFRCPKKFLNYQAFFFLMSSFKWLKNFDDNINIYTSFIVLKIGGIILTLAMIPNKAFHKTPNLIGSGWPSFDQ